MSDRKKLIERITKLLAKAEGTTNEAEANTFMEKVHSLLEEHNISLHELGDQDDPIVQDENIQVNRPLSYAVNLVPALGRYYGCQTVTSRGRKTNQFFVFGRQSATTTLHLMTPFVLSQVRQQARRLHNEGKSPTYGKALTAVANALTVRVNKLWEAEQVREEQRVASGGKALVPVDLVQAKVDETMDTVTTKSRMKGFTKGAKDAAERIGINRQTGKSHVGGLLT